MSLLTKVLKYKEEYLLDNTKGLLNKALSYLNSKNSYPSTNKLSNNSENINLKQNDTITQENPLATTDKEDIPNTENNIDESNIDTENNNNNKLEETNIEEDTINNETTQLNNENDILNKELTKELNIEFNDIENKIFYEIINNISIDLSKLVINENSYHNFTEIISHHFGFSKSILLVYSPVEKLFIFWDGKNISDETKNKIKIELNFNDIYSKLAKEKSFLLTKDDDRFANMKPRLSSIDFDDTSFQLWVPFIFSARIIGIFLGLKMSDEQIPSNIFTSAIEIIGRMNGPLLYNILQKQSMKTIINKTADNVVDNKINSNSISESTKDSELNTENNDNDVQVVINTQNAIPEYFNEDLQKIVIFVKNKILDNPDDLLSVIYFKINGTDQLNRTIPNFERSKFIDDIQFIAMNVVGTEGFVQIYEDYRMYIIIPELSLETANEMSSNIKNDLEKLFTEYLGAEYLDNKEKLSIEIFVKTYPTNANNYEELFNH